MLCAEMINNHNMHRKAQRTAEHEQIAAVDRESAADAQQPEAGDRARDTEPDRFRRLLMQKYREQRHNHDIQRRDESGFSGGRQRDATLLQGACNEQCDAAADAAAQGCYFVCRRRCVSRFFMSGPEYENDRNQHKAAANGKSTDNKG